LTILAGTTVFVLSKASNDDPAGDDLFVNRFFLLYSKSLAYIDFVLLV
jgi:hypothetical protein